MHQFDWCMLPKDLEFQLTSLTKALMWSLKRVQLIKFLSYSSGAF